MIESNALESSATVPTSPHMTFVQIWPVTECLVWETADPGSSPCDPQQSSKMSYVLFWIDITALTLVPYSDKPRMPGSAT
jgi:hypothetical protein